MAAAKGPLEFLCSAVAAFTDGKLTCWTASQETHLLRKQPAAMLASRKPMSAASVSTARAAIGRNGHEDAAVDAALLARAAGRPVRVRWMRADEHGWDPKGPPTLIDVHGGLDGDGQPRRVKNRIEGNIEQTTTPF